MADGRHVGKYLKCHNSLTNGPTGMQLGWSHLIMFSTCPPCAFHSRQFMYIIIIFFAVFNSFPFSFSAQRLPFSQVRLFSTIDLWYLTSGLPSGLRPLFGLIMLIGLLFFFNFHIIISFLVSGPVW